MIKKYYLGVGSRETPPDIMAKMTEIAGILEECGYILRSGHATGADLAFETGVIDPKNMNIYLPYEGFNDGYSTDTGLIYIPEDINDIDYSNAYASLKYHPRGYKLSKTSKEMMCRNYFQVHGRHNEPSSEFNICWTKDGKPVGGTAQSIRLCTASQIPIYNLGEIFIGWKPRDIVDVVLHYGGNMSVEKKPISLF